MFGVDDYVMGAIGADLGTELFGGDALGSLLTGDAYGSTLASALGFGGDSTMAQLGDYFGAGDMSNANYGAVYPTSAQSASLSLPGGDYSGGTGGGVTPPPDGVASGSGSSTFSAANLVPAAVQGASSGVVSSLAPLAAGAASFAGTQITNDTLRQIANSNNAFNAQQAANAMDFSERMSSSQWQRGVSDMEAAGLNPMLAYMKGPSSSPSGTSASASAIPSLGNALGNAVSSAQSGSSISGGLEKIEAEIELARAERLLKGAQERLVQEEAAVTPSRGALDRASADVRRAESKVLELEREMKALGIPAAENAAHMAETPYGAVKPYIDSIFGEVSSAAGAARGTGLLPNVYRRSR